MRAIILILVMFVLLLVVLGAKLLISGSIFGCDADARVTKTITSPSGRWVATIEKWECSSALSGVYFGVFVASAKSSHRDLVIDFEPEDDVLDISFSSDNHLEVILSRPETIFHQRTEVGDLDIGYTYLRSSSESLEDER